VRTPDSEAKLDNGSETKGEWGMSEYDTKGAQVTSSVKGKLPLAGDREHDLSTDSVPSMTKEELARREKDLYEAVSRQIADWGTHEEVLGAGLSMVEDERSAQPYCVRVYFHELAKGQPSEVPPWLPDSVTIHFDDGLRVVLPVIAS
jgi:hypothetical protein